MAQLSGKTALITGGGRGIGLGMVRQFARAGANVLIAELSNEHGQAAEREITEAGGKARFVRTDVSKKADIRNAIDAAVQTFGSLDILVNNAVKIASDELLENKTDEMFAEQLDIGLWAVWWAMREALPHLKASGDGRIVNFVSIDVDTGAWFHSDYSAAKGGVLGLTRSAAMEWSRFNIHVNAIAPIAASSSFDEMCAMRPGLRELADAMNPLGRMGDPTDDIAPVAVFLASDAARYVNGVVIPVDGGLHLPRSNNRPADLAPYERA